jgi:uncharacterized protein (DUF849 family)
MLMKAALNGNRPAGSHPALPLTPSEVADSANESVAAGAGAIHLHARDASGVESLAGADVARAVTAVRAKAGRVPVGVTTGAWIVSSPGERLALVAAWDVLPEFASVNFHEEGAEELAALLLDRGVGVEAGLPDARAAARWIGSELAGRCLRVLIEPQDADLPSALRTIGEIEAALDAAGVAAARLLHGTGATAWGLIEEAARRGYDTRVGLEDTLELPDGSVAVGNAELVAEGLRLYSRSG